MKKLAILELLTQAGCHFAIEVPAIGGFNTRIASPSQTLLLLEDKTAAHASLMGLSKPEYVEWHSSQGSVYCSATTKQGIRCRNTIIGGTQLSAEDWRELNLKGGYCATHGG